jgi:glutamate--cysteine ligase
MQAISGIHYNWSFPGVSSEQYFALIRNFRRRAFLLLYLFGATPAVCSTFVAGRNHQLQSLNGKAMYLPYATSLRMGRLGYQSDAQSSLAVSYNDLEGYAHSLEEAMTRSYAPYEAIGVRSPDGSYRQLATSLLQIENEFYGTIRPKRTIFAGERPLHALRERGVEYVEVRLMDLDPFEVQGISAQTMRFLDIFLLHWLSTDSPDDSREENAALARNQHAVAERGREPGLHLERNGESVTLTEWGLQLTKGMLPIAQALDAVHGSDTYSVALAAAQHSLHHPQTLPSARVLQAITEDHDSSFLSFVRTQSVKLKAAMLATPMDDATLAGMEHESEQSWVAQRHTEESDTMPFDIYLQEYLSPRRLLAGLGR